jgi:hypothetical protein
MNNLASQGGVDLSSILLQQLDHGVMSHGNLVVRSTGPCKFIPQCNTLFLNPNI